MPFLIGVDSGGSHTRALAVTLEGVRVGYAETGGGNPTHDEASRENVREAIRLAAQDCGIENVVRVVAGIAGYNYPDQLPAVQEATAVEGLTARRDHFNDAEVAHFGAFVGAPGIVAIQGTGSMIMGILEDGRQVRSGDFSHYARGGAVWVGINGLHRLLNGEVADPTVTSAAFDLWQVDSMATLRKTFECQKTLEVAERSRRQGALAHAITDAAQRGCRMSESVCEEAAKEIATGIRLLGSMFVGDDVQVSPIGACVRSAAVRRLVEKHLAAAPDKRYTTVDAVYAPAVGATLMALRAEGVPLDETLLSRFA